MAYAAGGLQGGRIEIFIGGGCAEWGQVEGRNWRREGRIVCVRRVRTRVHRMGVCVGRLRGRYKGVALVFCEHYPLAVAPDIRCWSVSRYGPILDPFIFYFYFCNMGCDIFFTC